MKRLPVASAAAIQATVVFIAPTQSGKSKAIEELYTIQSQPRPSASGYLRVGNGKQSMTSQSKLLPSVPLYYLHANTWESPGSDLKDKIAALSEARRTRSAGAEESQALSPEEIEALCAYRAQWKADQGWKANVRVDKDAPVVVMQEETCHRLELKCLDTPGLDDSFGRDDAHMEDILMAMSRSEVGSVIAFVVIVKNGQPFSDRFLKAVCRYWDQFPSFRHNWIFLHTAVDPSKTDYEGDSCYEQEIEQRRELLVASLKHRCQEDHEILKNLQHISVDNVIADEQKVKLDPSLAYGLELKKAHQADAYNSLFMAIASNKPVKVDQMKFRKTQSMIYIDEVVRARCSAFKKGLFETLETLEHQHTNLMGEYTKILGRINDKKVELDTKQAQIQDLDTDDPITHAEKVVERTWKLFGNNETINVVLKHKIAYREITCASEYAYSQVEDQGVQLHGENYVWKVKLSSPPLRGFKAILKAFIRKRDKYAVGINELKEEVFNLRKRLSELEWERERKEDDVKASGDKMTRLRERIDSLTADEVSLMSKDLDLPRYAQLKDFYREAEAICDGAHGDVDLLAKYIEARARG